MLFWSQYFLCSIEDGLTCLYLRLSRPATIPIMEDMLIIQPRSPEKCGGCFNIWAVAYLQPKNTDLTLTRIVVSQMFSSVRWHTAGVLASSPTPALLTKLSLPKSQWPCISESTQPVRLTCLVDQICRLQLGLGFPSDPHHQRRFGQRLHHLHLWRSDRAL